MVIYIKIVKAKINNRIVDVEIINAEYNDHAVEVKSVDDNYAKDVPFIVEKHDIIKISAKNKYKMADVEYIKGTEMMMGVYRPIWAARIGQHILASHCRTKKEAMDEARVSIKDLSNNA